MKSRAHQPDTEGDHSCGHALEQPVCSDAHGFRTHRPRGTGLCAKLFVGLRQIVQTVQAVQPLRSVQAVGSESFEGFNSSSSFLRVLSFRAKTGAMSLPGAQVKRFGKRGEGSAGSRNFTTKML